MSPSSDQNQAIEDSLELFINEFDQSIHEATRELNQISADNKKIQQLIRQLGGKEDSHDFRARLNAIVEVTKNNVKRTSDNLQQISQKMDCLPNDKKQKLNVTLREFQLTLERFQKLQEQIIVKSKEFVSQAQVMIHEEETSQNIPGEEKEPLMQHQLDPVKEQQLKSEISYNQMVIMSREQGIKEISAAMNEVSALYKDVGALASEQQFGFDNIAANIELISGQTRNAASEIRIAEDYRRRRPLVNCWYLILAVVITLIIISFIVSI